MTAMPTTGAPASGSTPAQPSFLPQHSRRWLAWALLAAVGLVMVMAGHRSTSQYQGSVASTAMVLAQMQAAAQMMSAQAQLAARGNPGAIDLMRTHRARVNTLRGLLRTGGRASPSDPAPVLILEGRDGFNLSALDQSLQRFDEQSRALEESAAQLRLASQAQADLSASLSQVSQSLSRVGEFPGLSSSAWESALAPSRAVLTRPEMRTMEVIFSPLRGADALQDSWADQFARTSTRMAELAAQAQRSPTLDAGAKEHMEQMAQAVETLAKATATLAAAQPVRVAAQEIQEPLQQAAQSISSALEQLGTQVLALQSTKPWGWYVAWMGVLVVLAGLAGLVHAALLLDSRQWKASQQTRSNQGLSASVERLTRQLRRIASGEVAAGAAARLDEDPDAETFALASMVNTLLDTTERLRGALVHSMDDIGMVMGDATGPAARLTSGARRLDDAAQAVSGLSRAIAQELARVAQAPAASRAQGMVEMTTAAELVMQEGAYKMEAMRETVQGTSKHLKRLAEGAQSIVAATNVIDGISRRVKVLATNAAIEAATHGEGGRKFAVLAKEIERLSQSAHEAAADIGRVVQAIQADAQETVAAMERSTAEVVASTDLAVKAGQALREIESASGDLVQDIGQALREVERQAVAGAKLSQGCDAAATIARELLADGEVLGAVLDRAKGRVREVRDGASSEARF